MIGGTQYFRLEADEAEKSRSSFRQEATVWNGDGKETLIDLSDLDDDITNSSVTGVSGDGTVIVGSYQKRLDEFTGLPGGIMMAFKGPAEITQSWVRIGDAKPINIGQLADIDEASTYVHAVSRDGSIVIGESEDLVPSEFPVAAATGFTKLGAPLLAPTVRLQRRAFRWTEKGGMKSLGVLRKDGFGWSSAIAVSDDGSVIAGNSEQIASKVTTCIGCYTPTVFRGFRWKAGKMVELKPVLSGHPTADGASSVNAISGDGSVIVGSSSSYFPSFGSAETATSMTPTTTQATKWDSDGPTGLGFLSKHDGSYSNADEVSADGSVIAGWSTTNIVESTSMYGTSYYDHAFRWTAKDGMKSLGSLSTKNRGNSYVNAMSADGSIIVGVSDTDGTLVTEEVEGREPDEQSVQRGFVWTQADGMQGVGTLRDKDDLGSSSVDAISRDGTVIVGRSETNRTDIADKGRGIDVETSRLFIMRVMQEDLGPMLDLQNTQNQVVGSGQQQSRGMGQLAGDLTGALDGELEVGGGGDPDQRVSTQGRARLRMPVAVNITALRTNAGTGLKTNNIRAQGAVGLTPYLTFGGFVQMGQQTDGIAGFDFNGNLRTAGLYIRGGQRFGQGLTWKLSYGQARGTAEISRVTGFANTEVGVGQADVKASAIRAELGYGYAIGRTAMHSFMRVAKSSASRDAFVETAGATFPISYNAFDIEHTTLTIGTSARLKVSTKGALTLGLSIDKDLNSSNNPITGTSAIPGFTNFSVAGPTVVNDTRATLSATYEHALSNGQSIVFGAYAGQARYGTEMASGISVGYTARW